MSAVSETSRADRGKVSSTAAVSGEGRPAGARILVADDDDNVRAGLAAILELEGYRVTETTNGADAIALLERAPFDLIISDVTMPLADGDELLAVLRQRELRTPFILITGLASQQLVDRSLGDGMFALLVKPISPERILEVTRRAIERNLLLTIGGSEPRALAIALQRIGMRVEVCADREAALEFVRNHRIDVCVVDFTTLPNGSWSLCQELRSLDDGILFLALVERSSSDTERRIGLTHGLACVRTPFGALELLAAIAGLRAEARARR